MNVCINQLFNSLENIWAASDFQMHDSLTSLLFNSTLTLKLNNKTLTLTSVDLGPQHNQLNGKKLNKLLTTTRFESGLSLLLPNSQL